MGTEVDPTSHEKHAIEKPLQPAFRIAGDWNGKAVHRIPKCGQLRITVTNAPTVLITVM
jgi:hypothetical protein